MKDSHPNLDEKNYAMDYISEHDKDIVVHEVHKRHFLKILVILKCTIQNY